LKFKANGRVLEADNMRVREVCEAEQALGVNLGETGLSGQLAVQLFVALRREDPEKSPGLLADEVWATEMESIGEADEEVEADPPAEAPGGEDDRENPEEDPENQQTSGPLLSEVSASR